MKPCSRASQQRRMAYQARPLASTASSMRQPAAASISSSGSTHQATAGHARAGAPSRRSASGLLLEGRDGGVGQVSSSGQKRDTVVGRQERPSPRRRAKRRPAARATRSWPRRTSTTAPERADARVLHDLQRPLALGAAAQAVGQVGQAVLREAPVIRRWSRCRRPPRRELPRAVAGKAERHDGEGDAGGHADQQAHAGEVQRAAPASVGPEAGRRTRGVRVPADRVKCCSATR